jgi:hypothetical protein
MSEFEFVFSLFGLLLGFSLVEVLGGLAKAVEARVRPVAGDEEPVRIGWLTPLLGVFVMLDLVSFWGAAWIARDGAVVSGRILFGGLFFAGSYYLAAHLVFPQSPRTERDLDVHYFKVRRLVLGTLTALLALQLAYWLSTPELAGVFKNPILMGRVALSFALLAAAMIVRGRRANTVVLVLMIAQYLYDYLIAG